MTTVLDVAKYILEQKGAMTVMKLQKLAYYSQAWSLVWDERPLFGDRIEAWANGPVSPVLYQAHRGHFNIVAGNLVDGDSSTLDAKARETVDAVLKFYGEKPAPWLSDLTHQEAPWLSARRGLAPGDRSSVEITQAAMAEYYGSL
jgi:uncharacterized phage-associated protein